MSDEIDFSNIEEILENIKIDKDTPSNQSISDVKQYDQDSFLLSHGIKV